MRPFRTRLAHAVAVALLLLAVSSSTALASGGPVDYASATPDDPGNGSAQAAATP